MKIKVLYREITNCIMCPYCQDDQVEFGDQACTHPENALAEISETSIPPTCPLPDMRLDTEDDSSE